MTGVLLATDGSDHAEQAGARAIELAGQRGVPLHVLCVIDRREFGETALGTSELATIAAEDRGHRSVDASVIVMGKHGDHRMHTGGVAKRVRRQANRETVLVSAKRPA